MVPSSSKRTLKNHPTSSQSSNTDIPQFKDPSPDGVDRDALDAHENPNQTEDLERKNEFDRVDDREGDNEHCVICLHEIRDRTILPCAHDRLCFECIFVWCQQSRKCPLCNAPIGPYLIHNFRSSYDYSKHYLTPLDSFSVPNSLPIRRPSETRAVQRNSEVVQWGRRRSTQTPQERASQLELAISKRRWIYRHGLYALHVASNSHTRHRPAPTPAQFTASQDIISRATIFIRRELHVWVNLDIEFLTTFILSLMKSIDIRSESAIKLLAEFLDMDIPYHFGKVDEPSRGRFPNAEHFAHELYSYLRSPFKDLPAYDKAVQYEIPSDIPAPPDKPLLNRHEGHWGVPLSYQAQVESSLRTRREESHSSYPSHLCSPREAFSPSPPLSNAYDDLHQYHRYHYRPWAVSQSSPNSNHSRSSSSGRSGTRDCFRHNNKDIKGKGKTTKRTDRSRSRSRSRSPSLPRLNRDTWKSNRTENALRTNDIFQKQRRSISRSSNKKRCLARQTHRVGRYENTRTEHFLITSDNDAGDPSSISEEHLKTQSEAQTERKNAQTSTNIKLIPLRACNDAHNVDEKAIKMNDIPPTGVPASADHLTDVPIRPNWGISIKGQAKLLAMGGEKGITDEVQPLSGFSRQTSLTSEDPTSNSTISPTRQRRPSELFYVHHLGNSGAARRINGSILEISSPYAIAAHDTATNKNVRSISSEYGSRDATGLEVTPQKPSSDRPSPISAREVMVRTPDGFVKMQNDISTRNPDLGNSDLLANVAPNSNSNPELVRPVSETVKSYLLRQLEEEHGQVREKLHNYLQVSNSTSIHHGIAEVKRRVIGRDSCEHICPVTQPDLVSREQLLKAALLSRIK